LVLGNDLNIALGKISMVVTEVYKFSQEIAPPPPSSLTLLADRQGHFTLTKSPRKINSAVEEQASGAQAVVRPWKRCASCSAIHIQPTELAAAADQMNKLSGDLLDSMDRSASTMRPNRDPA